MTYVRCEYCGTFSGMSGYGTCTCGACGAGLKMPKEVPAQMVRPMVGYACTTSLTGEFWGTTGDYRRFDVTP